MKLSIKNNEIQRLNNQCSKSNPNFAKIVFERLAEKAKFKEFCMNLELKVGEQKQEEITLQAILTKIRKLLISYKIKCKLMAIKLKNFATVTK